MTFRLLNIKARHLFAVGPATAYRTLGSSVTNNLVLHFST